MIYVIYDQFHWLRKDHLVCKVRGRKAAFERYLWIKECYPDLSLGFLDLDKFDKLVDSFKYDPLYDRKK